MRRLRDSILRPRSSAPILRLDLAIRLAFFALMVSAIAAAPLRLPAQESQPAPAAQAPASSSGQTAAPAPASSAEEGDNVFLQSSAVKATAKRLHLSLETTEAILLGINFAIIVFGIGIPLFRWLPKFLRARSEKIRANLESARKATGDAAARLNAIESRLAGLDGEIAQIRAQVEAESLEDEKRIKSTIQEETARIVAAASQEMDASAAQARRSLRNFAADLAIGRAAREIVLTPETDQALIAEFLASASLNPTPGNGAKKGGQN